MSAPKPDIFKRGYVRRSEFSPCSCCRRERIPATHSRRSQLGNGENGCLGSYDYTAKASFAPFSNSDWLGELLVCPIDHL